MKSAMKTIKEARQAVAPARGRGLKSGCIRFSRRDVLSPPQGGVD